MAPFRSRAVFRRSARIVLGVAVVACAFANSFGLSLAAADAASSSGRALGEFVRTGRSYALQPFTTKTTGQQRVTTRQRGQSSLRVVSNLVASVVLAAAIAWCWSISGPQRPGFLNRRVANRLRGPPAASVPST